MPFCTSALEERVGPLGRTSISVASTTPSGCRVAGRGPRRRAGTSLSVVNLPFHFGLRGAADALAVHDELIALSATPRSLQMFQRPGGCGRKCRPSCRRRRCPEDHPQCAIAGLHGNSLTRARMSSMSKTSMPARRPALAFVGELLRDPEARLLAPTISCTPSVQPGMTSSRRNVAGSPRVDRAVEHLAVGRPARVVDRHAALFGRVLRAGAGLRAPCRPGPTRSSSRPRAARPRRPGRRFGDGDDLEQLDVEHQHALRAARPALDRRAPAESRSGASRRRPSAARPRPSP